MSRDLIEMRKELAAIFAGNAALKQAVREVSKLDIIKGCLIARIPKHQDINISSILAGELQKDVSIGDYMFIQNGDALVKVAYNNLKLGNSVNPHMLVESYRILAEDPEGTYRRTNPVVYSLNHVPPEFENIENRLAGSFRQVYAGNLEDDIVARAMYMYNAIVDVWPFDEFNGEIAVFAMNYYLMENGFMPIDMPMNKGEFDELIGACLKGIRPNEEYEFFKNAIAEKMAGTIEACKRMI